MSATLRFWNSSGDGRLALASVPTRSAMDMMGVVDNKGSWASSRFITDYKVEFVGDFRQEHSERQSISVANHKPIFGFRLVWSSS